MSYSLIPYQIYGEAVWQPCFSESSTGCKGWHFLCLWTLYSWQRLFSLFCPVVLIFFSLCNTTRRRKMKYSSLHSRRKHFDAVTNSSEKSKLVNWNMPVFSNLLLNEMQKFLHFRHTVDHRSVCMCWVGKHCALTLLGRLIIQPLQSSTAVLLWTFVFELLKLQWNV